MLDDDNTEKINKSSSNLSFNEYQEYILRFWNSKPFKMRFNESLFINPNAATELYLKSITKFDGKERMQLLMDYLQLSLGYNLNDYGYINRMSNIKAKNASTREQYMDHYESVYITPIIGKIDSLAVENPDLIDYAVRANYYVGVATSGYSFLGEVKINNMSKKYFNKVINLTKEKEISVLRTYTELLLSKGTEE